MKMLRRVTALIDHNPIEGEFGGLELLDETEFQAAKARHLCRRRMPARTDNAGVTFLLSLLGAPTFLVLGLVKGDGPILGASVFWLIVSLVSFTYLAFTAKYWREHHAIIFEEVRRYGVASFG